MPKPTGSTRFHRKMRQSWALTGKLMDKTSLKVWTEAGMM